ncbi:aldehyde dehydrogenase [Thozetella sp. PMI_491]|nr:aldehyde dehydrogenase [Thozetella sp. PMI_491]
MVSNIVPLIIHGESVVLDGSLSERVFIPNPDITHLDDWKAQGATREVCLRSIDSCAQAFPGWRGTQPSDRQRLFNQLARLLRESADELRATIQEEIGCSEKWASINVEDTIGMVEQVAAITTSGVLAGTVPEVRASGAHAVVFKEPLGVVLGIAPWNAPAVLGLRSVAAPVAAGNCAIFKGSELSPRTHYFIAKSFQDAGFPPGVVNFLIHRPEDAPEIFETLISHPAIRKCNFTGSTAVGRHIAARAAQFLKPVLLELGGKNFAIVLDDADFSVAADAILEGAFLNSGQICMSTDLVLVSEAKKSLLCEMLRERLKSASQNVTRTINAKSGARVKALQDDAVNKGASVSTASGGEGLEDGLLIENVSPDMDFWHQESFGPVVGIAVYRDINEAVAIVNDCSYGLSTALFTQPTLSALELASRLNVGAIHINGPTVHDEPTLPHGGHKDSGWGRFGGCWGFEEFLHTKTVIMNQ